VLLVSLSLSHVLSREQALRVWEHMCVLRKC
jgi:hypothetical protein